MISDFVRNHCKVTNEHKCLQSKFLFSQDIQTQGKIIFQEGKEVDILIVMTRKTFLRLILNEKRERIVNLFIVKSMRKNGRRKTWHGWVERVHWVQFNRGIKSGDIERQFCLLSMNGVLWQHQKTQNIKNHRSSWIELVRFFFRFLWVPFPSKHCLLSLNHCLLLFMFFSHHSV